MPKKDEWAINLPATVRRRGGALQRDLFDQRLARRYEELMKYEGRKRGLAIDIDMIIALYAISKMGEITHQTAVAYRELVENLLEVADSVMGVEQKKSVVEFIQLSMGFAAQNMMVACNLTQEKLTEYIEQSPYPHERLLRRKLNILQRIFLKGDDYDIY